MTAPELSPPPIQPVLLAGGAGTRLWPLSRERYPKQFLKLTGERSLMQETLLRLEPLEARQPCIVCNEEHRFLVAEQCREVGQTPRAILLEAEPRNTAPAIGLAACHARAAGDDPLLLVVPADGRIEQGNAFVAAVGAGLEAAAAGRLVLFGAKPTAAETGYGYIRAGSPAEGGARHVLEFVEKPDRAGAQRYLASGEFHWNTSIFLFKASAFVASLAHHAPDVLACCEAAIANGREDLDFFRPSPAFTRSPSISIDYAVMEKTDAAAVVPVEMGWSDVGSWPAVRGIGEADAANNAVSGDVIAVDAKDSLIHATHRLVAAVGVRDLIVVETADAVLVAAEGAAQQVKDVVARLKAEARPERINHRRVYRPWGWFETIDAGTGYQVKRITVKSGAQLSLQRHRHRSEHWVVVSGEARVTRDAETFSLRGNESTYIPPGARHRLGNPGSAPLELIEVQVGEYLGEDDIERFADDFGRGAPTREMANGDENPRDAAGA